MRHGKLCSQFFCPAGTVIMKAREERNAIHDISVLCAGFSMYTF